MKRPLDEVLRDLPDIADKHIAVPEIKIGKVEKIRSKKKRRSWMYALAGLAAALAVMIFVYFPFNNVSAEIIDNGFNPPEDKVVLKASPKDEASLRKVMDDVVKARYKDKEFEKYEVQSVALAPQSPEGWKDIVKANTSEKVYQNTWIVQLYFPDMDKVSASMSQGQLFIAKTKAGWVVWSQYH